jgi:hypothetical protein
MINAITGRQEDDDKGRAMQTTPQRTVGKSTSGDPIIDGAAIV